MALFRRKAEQVRPLDGVDLVLADLDGVVYTGADPIPHAVESLNRAAETVRVGYITNNASRTDASVAEHLNDLGLHVQPADVVTSPQAAVRLLAQHVAAGSTILVVGGDGLVDEVQKGGFRVTRSAEDEPAAVIQGFSPDVGWEHLAEAAFALQGRSDAERPWVATNTDWTIPVARGIAPGNGTLVSAVHTAVGPAAAGRRQARSGDLRGGGEPVRGVEAALHRRPAGHGHHGREPGRHRVRARPHRDRPGQAADRGGRRTRARPTSSTTSGASPNRTRRPSSARGDAVATVRGATVALEGDTVRIRAEGESELDLLRAACAVIWRSGRAIYGLEVPERLYS